MNEAAAELRIYYILYPISLMRGSQRYGAEDTVVERMGGNHAELPADALPHWNQPKYDLIDLNSESRLQEPVSLFIRKGHITKSTYQFFPR